MTRILALLAGCTAQAAPPLVGGGAAASVAGTPHASDTYANCVASTPTAAGDVCHPSDSPYTLLSRDGSTWVYRYPGIGFDVTPPPSAGWTARGGGTVTTVGGMRRLDLAGSSALNQGETRAVPAASGYWVDMCVVVPTGHNGEHGAAWYQTSDGKLVYFRGNTIGGGGYNLQNYTSIDVFGANVSQITGPPAGDTWCFRLQDNATNRLPYLGTAKYGTPASSTSPWPILGAGVSRTNHLTADHVGWVSYINDADGDADVYLVHWAAGTYTP